MKKNDWQTLDAWFRTRTAELLGEDLSLRHELLPLLHDPFAFSWKTVSGGSLWLLQGSADRSLLPERLDRLHASFRNTLNRHILQERVFPERPAGVGRGFRSAILGEDNAPLKETNGTTAGWNVRTASKGRQELATALRGHRFAVSTDGEWLLRAIRGVNIAERLPSPTEMLGGGLIREVDMAAHIPETSLLKLLLPKETSYRFAIYTRGPVLILSWRKEKNARL